MKISLITVQNGLLRQLWSPPIIFVRRAVRHVAGQIKPGQLARRFEPRAVRRRFLDAQYQIAPFPISVLRLANAEAVSSRDPFARLSRPNTRIDD